MRKLGTGIIGRVGALAISIATVVGCGDSGVVQIDAPPDIDAPIDAPLPPAQLSISPASTDFGSQLEDTTSTAMSFTVTNTGGSPSGSISPQIMGSGAAHFDIETTTCTTLDVNATCTVQVSFTPDTPGNKSANLVVSASPGGSVSAGLDGLGLALGNISISPGTQAFGDVVAGTTGPTVGTFTVTNTGGSPTGTLTTTLTGSDPGSFNVQSNTCTGTLAGSATCTITVVFMPSSPGMKTASLLVTGSPGGTATAALSGNALQNARLSINPTILDFGTVVANQVSANQTFTVTNTGGVASGMVTPTLSGVEANQFRIASSNCSAPLAPNASCNVVVRFEPTSAAPKAAQLDVTAAPGGTTSATLLGTGQAPGEISISPTSFAYADTTVGMVSVSQTFTVTNTGGAPTGALATALGGGAPGDFQIVNGSNGCQGTTLAAGGVCTIAIVFAPTVSGPLSANITVSGTPGGTAVAGLNGNGIDPAIITIEPASRDFGSVGTGTVTPAQNFVVRNVGGQSTGALAASVNGPQSGQFQASLGACQGVVLVVNGTCTITVRFAPSINGPAQATLDVSGAPGGADSSGLFGQGVDPAALAQVPTGTILFDDSAQNNGPGFGLYEEVLLGESSIETYILRNNGIEPTGIITFQESGDNPGDFSFTDTCPDAAGLPAGNECTVTVTFTPTVSGVRRANIIATATPGGVISTPLEGTALPRLQLLAPNDNPFVFDAAVVDINPASAQTVAIEVQNNTRNDETLTLNTSAFGTTNLPFEIISNGCTNISGTGTLDSDDSCTIIVRFEPDATGNFSVDAIFAIGGGGAFNTATQELEGQGVDSMFFEAGPRDFGIVAVGKASNALSFTVTNPSAAPTTGPVGTSISNNNFQIIGDTCAGLPLGSGASCTIQVRFLPTALGSASAVLTVSAFPFGGTTQITITGTGVNPAALTFSPSGASLSFADTFSGSSSPATIVVTNPSNSEDAGPLTFSLTGGDAALYTVNPGGNPGGDCTTGIVLEAGESCTFRFTFSPTGTVFGAKNNATFTVTTAPGPGTPLAGRSFTMDADSVSTISITTPTSQTFSFGTLNQGQTVTQDFIVRNFSPTAVSIASAMILPNETHTTITANGCTAPLAANVGTCTITVQFSSTVAGSYSSSLVVDATTGGNPTGTATRTINATVRTSPALSWAPAAQDYASLLAGSAAGETYTFTLTNTGTTGTAALTVMNSNPMDFTLTNSGAGSCSTFAAGLPGLGTCTVTVKFTPMNVAPFGNKTATLIAVAGVTANSSLTGRAMEPGEITISPTSQNFGNDVIGGTGVAAPQPFTVQNTSNNTVTFTTVFSGDFLVAVPGGTCTGTLGPSASCTVLAVFNATASGTRTGTLTIDNADVAANDAFANLTGNGQTPANVACIITTNFPAAGTPLGTASQRVYSCSNTGQVASGTFTVTGPTGADAGLFSLSGPCIGQPVPATGGCTFTVTFAPLINPGMKTAAFTYGANPGLNPAVVENLNVNAITQAVLGITPTTVQSAGSRAAGALDTTPTGTVFTITNGGDAPSGILSFATGNPNYRIDLAAGTCDNQVGNRLAGNTSCTLVIRFDPAAGATLGPSNAAVSVSATPGGTVNGVITGVVTAALVATPSTGMFADTPAGGASGTITFNVENNAAVATGLLTTTFDGANEVDFSLVSDSCAGKTLGVFGAVDDTCTIVARFVPRGTGGTGSRTATITVAGTPGNFAVITLTGIALPAP
ncbi:MAG: choice-of-anchor D domain-containing protein [Kofleriaceae bacterium]